VDGTYVLSVCTPTDIIKKMSLKIQLTIIRNQLLVLDNPLKMYFLLLFDKLEFSGLYRISCFSSVEMGGGLKKVLKKILLQKTWFYLYSVSLRLS